jgi:formate hydrogenlyase transcriptional activator
VFPIEVPSLRVRVEDIALLVEYFIDRYAKKACKKIKSITKKSLDLFQTNDWPGNIRELQNVIERAVILCDGAKFSIDQSWLTSEPSRESLRAAAASSSGLGRDPARERELIESALAATVGFQVLPGLQAGSEFRVKHSSRRFAAFGSTSTVPAKLS